MIRAAFVGLLILSPSLGEQRKAECLERLEAVRIAAERNLCWAEGINTAVRSQRIRRGYPTLARIQLNIRSMVGSWRRTARDYVESAEDTLEDVRETDLEQFADDRYYRKMMNDLLDTEELAEDVEEEMGQFLYQLRKGPSMGIDMDGLRKECDGEDEGNCSVKPWARPPADSPSMATEHPTKRPRSTSMGTEAQSGDATHGVGTIRSGSPAA